MFLLSSNLHLHLEHFLLVHVHALQAEWHIGGGFSRRSFAGGADAEHGRCVMALTFAPSREIA